MCFEFKRGNERAKNEKHGSTDFYPARRADKAEVNANNCAALISFFWDVAYPWIERVENYNRSLAYIFSSTEDDREIGWCLAIREEIFSTISPQSETELRAWFAAAIQKSVSVLGHKLLSAVCEAPLMRLFLILYTVNSIIALMGRI